MTTGERATVHRCLLTPDASVRFVAMPDPAACGVIWGSRSLPSEHVRLEPAEDACRHVYEDVWPRVAALTHTVRTFEKRPARNAVFTDEEASWRICPCGHRLLRASKTYGAPCYPSSQGPLRWPLATVGSWWRMPSPLPAGILHLWFLSAALNGCPPSLQLASPLRQCLVVQLFGGKSESAFGWRLYELERRAPNLPLQDERGVTINIAS